MTERKEPTVSSVLDDKEDLAERRLNAQRQTRRNIANPTEASTTTAARGGRHTPPPRAEANKNAQSSSSGFTWFVFLLTLCIGAATAYLVWQLDIAQHTIKDQRLRIVQLENKLAISDDSASQSLASVSAQVRELNSKSIQADSEIAKLWATRNVNRDGIKGAEEKITELGKKVTSDVARLQREQKKLASLSSSLDSLKQSVDKLQSLPAVVASTNQSVSEQDILLRALREKVAVHTEQLKVLGSQANKGVSAANKLTALERRVKETEEIITSLEAFRRSTTRDLLQLKQP